MDAFVTLNARSRLPQLAPALRAVIYDLDDGGALSTILVEEDLDLDAPGGVDGPVTALTCHPHAGTTDAVIAAATWHDVTLTSRDRGRVTLTVPREDGVITTLHINHVDWPDRDVATAVAAVLTRWDDILHAGRPTELDPALSSDTGPGVIADTDPTWGSLDDVIAFLADPTADRAGAHRQQAVVAALCTQVHDHLYTGTYGEPVQAGPVATTLATFLADAQTDIGYSTDDILSTIMTAVDDALLNSSGGQFTLDTARSLTSDTPERPLARPRTTPAVDAPGR